MHRKKWVGSRKLEAGEMIILERSDMHREVHTSFNDGTVGGQRVNVKRESSIHMRSLDSLTPDRNTITIIHIARTCLILDA